MLYCFLLSPCYGYKKNVHSHRLNSNKANGVVIVAGSSTEEGNPGGSVGIGAGNGSIGGDVHLIGGDGGGSSRRNHRAGDVVLQGGASYDETLEGGVKLLR